MWVWWVVFVVWVIPISLLCILLCLAIIAHEIMIIKEEIERWKHQ